MSVIDDIDAAGNASYSVSDVSDELAANKQVLQRAATELGISWELWVLVLAMGMLETQSMNPADRDASKDGAGLAANVSAWNLSLDLVQQVGTYSGNPWDLCKIENVRDVVAIIRDGISKWGVNSLLNFVRGGRTGWQDGYSYGVYEFRNAIKTMANAIRSNHDLLLNRQRVNVYVPHV